MGLQFSHPIPLGYNLNLHSNMYKYDNMLGLLSSFRIIGLYNVCEFKACLKHVYHLYGTHGALKLLCKSFFDTKCVVRKKVTPQ